MRLKEITTVKTTTLIDKTLLEEIDRSNPFHTRREFFEKACREYLLDLHRKWTDNQLEKACMEAAREDEAVNSEWEDIGLETWK